MKEEMKKYMLFSPIGDSDPLRNDYDGPMLHIVRHYKPWKVVLYLTAKMQSNEENYDNWYSGYVRRLAPETKIEIVNGGEERVFDFREFHKGYRECIARLVAEAPDSTILLNMSSGTPQMESALSIIAATNPYGHDRLLPIQVVTPASKSNRDVSHIKEGDVCESMEDLGDKTNRCVTVNFENYVQSFVRESVKHQINAMDYSGALELAMQNRAYFSQEFLHALNGARLRANFRLDEALKEFQKIGWQSKNVRAIEHEPYKSYAEYYLYMRRNFVRADYAPFVLSLPPITIQMQLYILKNTCGLDMERDYITNKGRLKSALLKQKLPQLANHLEASLNSELTDSFISVFLLNYVLVYFSINASGQNKLLTELLTEFQWIRTIEENLRNVTAHSLKGLSETDIRTECSVSKVSDAWERFSKLFLKVFAGSPIKSEVLDNYDSMNKLLIDMLAAEK